MRNLRGLRRILLDFKRHPWLHLISLSTISVALVILGIFLICYRNFERIAETTNPNTTGTIYLQENLTAGQVQFLKERILALENVQRVTFKTKDTVLRELSAFLGSADNEPITPGELFPDVLEIELKRDAPSSAVTILKATLTQYPEVTESDFSEDWLAQYKKLRNLFRWVGIILIAGTVLGCAFLIANFMGMRHQQRKSEIDIVRLIGANQQFVMSPFLWEGVIEGCLGTLSALIALVVIRRMITALGPTEWSSVLGVQNWLFLSPLQLLFFVVLGISMAFLGSIGVFLRFRENVK
ncbi:MAG: FtsX-like permease family protein [Deltaproteobacteria bacterium]|nr:FtsX-like permease family protein [Deltaproteobacteria bacterium]MBI3293408.1 FtsX-like permease family protein [Deltaproteobacteria bacterium]